MAGQDQGQVTWRQGLARLFAVVALVIAGLSLAYPSYAQDRARMVELLREGSDFRVRVQAAFAVGNTRDPILRPQLERALKDEHPAVRAAAATGLARLGSPRAIPALRRLSRDPSQAVRDQAVRSIAELSQPRSNAAASPAEALSGPFNWAQIRAALVVGEMRNRSDFRRGRRLEIYFREQVANNLGQLTRVAVFPDADAINAATRAQLNRRRLPTLRLDGSLMEVHSEQRQSQLAVRCEVSLMLLEDSTRDIRGMLRGTATGMGGGGRDHARQEEQLAEQALSAAVRSALSTVDVAIARASRR